MLPSKNLLIIAEVYGNSDYEQSPQPVHSTPKPKPKPRTHRTTFIPGSYYASPVHSLPVTSELPSEPLLTSGLGCCCCRKYSAVALSNGKKVGPEELQPSSAKHPIPKLRLQNKVPVRYKEEKTLTTPEIEAALKNHPKKFKRNSSIELENNRPHQLHEVASKRRRSSRRKSSFYGYPNESVEYSDESVIVNKPTCPECGTTRSSHKTIARHYNTIHKGFRLTCPWCQKLYTISSFDGHLKNVKCFKNFDTPSMDYDSLI